MLGLRLWIFLYAGLGIPTTSSGSQVHYYDEVNRIYFKNCPKFVGQGCTSGPTGLYPPCFPCCYATDSQRRTGGREFASDTRRPQYLVNRSSPAARSIAASTDVSLGTGHVGRSFLPEAVATTTSRRDISAMALS